MKKISVLFIIIIIAIAFYQCKTTKESTHITIYKDSLNITEPIASISIHIEKGKAYNHPSFVIWKADMTGNYLETIFITRSYATGIFGHAALTDSTWDNKPGESIQPSALPYWTYKKGLIDNAILIPTKEHPFVDAYTGATPKGDFRFETRTNNAEKFRVLLEVNQPWDWNSYWTNNKFPKSESYKHSAQPSLIYAVTINATVKEYYLNPVGHGDPNGENGSLYTNISTMTSAKDIFKSIKIEIQ